MPTKVTKKDDSKEESSRSTKSKSTSQASRSGKKLTREQIVEAIESLTVVELVELKDDLAERWNVSLTAAVVAAQPAAAAEASAEEEVTEFDVILSSIGEKKIPVIKVVREVTSLGLKEAKEVVESAPSPVKERVSKEVAQEIKGKLEEVGATAEIKASE